jgi:hypothetical protein
MTRGTHEAGSDQAHESGQTTRYDEGPASQNDQIGRQEARTLPADEGAPDDVVIMPGEQAAQLDDQPGSGGTPSGASPARVFTVPSAAAEHDSAAAATGAASAAEPVSAESVSAEPVPAESTSADSVSAEHESAESVPAEHGSAEQVPAAAAAADRASLGVRWHEIQAMFVDDPRTSVELAAGLVDDSTELHVASLRERQQALRLTWQGTDADTEGLRSALQQYRAFWNRMEEFSRLRA